MNNSRQLRPTVHKWPWKVAGVFIFILAVSGAFNLAAMLVDREPPVRFLEREALSDKVPQGGILQVRFRLERERFCKSELHRWVIDSALTKHAISSYTTSLVPTLGVTQDVREIVVPPTAALGEASYYVETHYYCNVLQRAFEWPIIVRSPDVRFQVTPEEKSDVTPTDEIMLKEVRRMYPLLRYWAQDRAQNDYRN